MRMVTENPLDIIATNHDYIRRGRSRLEHGMTEHGAL